jgi:hypothetical protein
MRLNPDAWAGAAMLAAAIITGVPLARTGVFRFWRCQKHGHRAYRSGQALRLYRYWCSTCQRGWGRVR